MSTLYINQQTEAEKDQFLFECFHDTGIINELVDSNFSVLSGRKGAGKTAIARYLEKYPDKFGIDRVIRLSIRNFNMFRQKSEKDILDSILFYLITKIVQKLLGAKLFEKDGIEFWNQFLIDNGLQNVTDYESFITTKKSIKSGFSLKAAASIFFGKVESEGNRELLSEKIRVNIATAPSTLFEQLRQSIRTEEKILIFIDDISDYLDESKEETLKSDINVIKELLLQLQSYNSSFIDSEMNIRLVSLVRDDLFEFMEGSNINKIKSDSLKLVWSEKDFASLLVRRMAVFKDDIDSALLEPVKNLKKWFPDIIFSDALKDFSTNRYGCNFYAYMAAISFNRPRDYLQFCYALRNRLSTTHPATLENINSAEIEYCDYFIRELRDELFIASKVFNYDISGERINILVDIMSKRDSFNAPELKVELGKFINEKVGNKKIELLVTELYRYGVIGIKEKNDKIIRFKYLSDSGVFTSEKIKQYIYYLHRGLWWLTKKYRSKL